MGQDDDERRAAPAARGQDHVEGRGRQRLGDNEHAIVGQVPQREFDVGRLERRPGRGLRELRLSFNRWLFEWIRVRRIWIGRFGRRATRVPEDRDVPDASPGEIEQHHLARRVVTELADELDVRPGRCRRCPDTDSRSCRLLLRPSEPEVRTTDDDDHVRQPTARPAESISRPRAAAG